MRHIFSNNFTQFSLPKLSREEIKSEKKHSEYAATEKFVELSNICQPFGGLRKRYRKNYRSLTNCRNWTTFFIIYRFTSPQPVIRFIFKGESEKIHTILFILQLFFWQRTLKKFHDTLQYIQRQPAFEEIVQNWNPSAISMFFQRRLGIGINSRCVNTS
jgi:hypothetical protein